MKNQSYCVECYAEVERGTKLCDDCKPQKKKERPKTFDVDVTGEEWTRVKSPYKDYAKYPKTGQPK